MKITKQFYGVNSLTKFIEYFKDYDNKECPSVQYNKLEIGEDIPLESRKTIDLSLNSKCISDFFMDITTDRMCALDGISLCRDEKLIFTQYQEPYGKENPHITNSMCKTIVAIAIMFAISEKRISEDDCLISFFPEYDTILTSKYTKQITIAHLLTMTSCSKCNEIITVTEQDWVKAFMLSDCQFEPGSRFIYNSMNTYMLAVVLRKVTGCSLMEYLKNRLFIPLNILNTKWELCPNGMERGGWGLHLSLDGMIKIGVFLANNGSFHGTQLIPAEYIEKMKQNIVKQEADSYAVAYGYQLWLLPNHFYMLSGMFGQHVIIDEKHKMVVAMNAHNDKMFPDSVLVRKVVDFLSNPQLYQSDSFLIENKNYYYLMSQVRRFRNNIFMSEKEKRKKKVLLEQCINYIDNKRLHIEHTTFKLFPYLMQGMYLYPPFHVSDFMFHKTDDALKVKFVKQKSDKKTSNGYETLQIDYGLNCFIKQTIQIGNDKRIIAAKASYASDEEQTKVVILEFVFPDCGFGRKIKLFLCGERISIESIEYPNVREIADQFISGETILAGTKIDLSDKLPQNLRVLFEQTVEPKLNGILHSK